MQYCSFSRKDFNRQLKCVNHSHAMFASIHAYTINTFGGAGTGESHLFIACENYFKLPIESKMVPLLLNLSSYQIYRAASIFAFAVIHLFVLIFCFSLWLLHCCVAIRRRDVSGTPETRHFYFYEFTSCSYDVIFVLVIEFKCFPFRSLVLVVRAAFSHSRSQMANIVWWIDDMTLQPNKFMEIRGEMLTNLLFTFIPLIFWSRQIHLARLEAMTKRSSLGVWMRDECKLGIISALICGRNVNRNSQICRYLRVQIIEFLLLS